MPSMAVEGILVGCASDRCRAGLARPFEIRNEDFSVRCFSFGEGLTNRHSVTALPKSLTEMPSQMGILMWDDRHERKLDVIRVP
jgi:hypothetical protein